MAKPVNLSIVIPTIGRPTLARTLKSMIPQVIEGDEILVIADTAGQVYNARRTLIRQRRHLHTKYTHATFAVGPGNEQGQGYAQREFGLRYATKSHIIFMDDDDVYEPGAFALFREHACEVPVIFKMKHPILGIVWSEPVLRFGNIGTPMFVVPNKKHKLGAWEAHTQMNGKYVGGDYEFIRGSVENLGEPVWREEIVATVRPSQVAGRL